MSKKNQKNQRTQPQVMRPQMIERLMVAVSLENDEISVKTFQDIKLAQDYLVGLGDISIRIDLHGVLDKIPLDVKIPNSVVISYVGDVMFDHALKEISTRVLEKQVSHVILVFKRGKGPNANKYKDPGSKAWVCDNISFDKKALFLDDGEDHIRSVDSLGIKKHFAVLVTKNTNIIQELERYF